MANEKNAVRHKGGNQPECFPCCGEEPQQGWSPLGNFIWCELCGNKMYSDLYNQWELGEQWNEKQSETPQPLSEAQAKIWSDAESRSRADKDLKITSGRHIGDLNYDE